MITILPLTDSEEKDQILQAVQGAEDNAEILFMSDGGEELGFVVVDVKSSTVRMLKMQLRDSSGAQGILCADSMMKATASYGAAVGAYRIESCIPEFKEYFQSCGFQCSDGKSLCPIETFVKTCNH